MPHVTFIHGISNKPPAEILRAAREAALADGGLDLGAEGVTTSLIYWADVLYPAPEASVTAFESVEEGLGTAVTDDDLSWVDDLPDPEREFVEKLDARLGIEQGEEPGPEAGEQPRGADDPALEALPLPWPLKCRLMRVLLRDVHHYLFNATHSPRPGESYRVHEHIRLLFIDQLREDAGATEGAHVVVSHSMGTVIAYDCLKNVSGCPAIDGFLTVGSPLGLSEVHDNFRPPYVRREAFPSDRLSGRWVNVSDRLDPVALDARLANDYQLGGREVIIDRAVRNEGRWRHSSGKYFRQAELVGRLRELLAL